MCKVSLLFSGLYARCPYYVVLDMQSLTTATQRNSQVAKLPVFEVTITRMATAFSSFQPKGDLLGNAWKLETEVSLNRLKTC